MSMENIPECQHDLSICPICGGKPKHPSGGLVSLDVKQRIVLNNFIKDVLIDLAQEKIELLDAYELIVKRLEPKFGRHF